MRALLWPLLVALTLSNEAYAQTRCSSLDLTNALTVELLRSEATALAKLSKSPTYLGIIKQGLKRVGASAYYSAVAAGAITYCMAQNVPSSQLPSTSQLRDYLLGDDQGSDCAEKLKLIRSKTEEVRWRYNELLIDRHDLFLNHRTGASAHPDYGSFDGHVQQFRDQQTNLRKQIVGFRSGGCAGDLSESDKWASIAVPLRPR